MRGSFSLWKLTNSEYLELGIHSDSHSLPKYIRKKVIIKCRRKHDSFFRYYSNLIQWRPLRWALTLSLFGGPIAAHAAGLTGGNPADLVPQLASPNAPAKLQSNPAAPLTPAQQAVQARLQTVIVPRYFNVTGVHSIDFKSVTDLLTPLAGKPITIAALAQVVDKITEMYREKGYALSFAVLQNQTFANGLVVVTVVEGYIDKVVINGDIGNSRARLQALSEPLTAQRPTTRAELERALNLMRQVPGITLAAHLDLPKRADGATELLIDATHKPVSVNGGLVRLQNGFQPLINMSTNSLTPLGEQIKLVGAIPLNGTDVRYVGAQIAVPISNNGLALNIDGYHYEDQPYDQALHDEGFNRKVTTNRVGVGLSYPFLLSNSQSLTGHAGLYAVNSDDRYNGRGNDLYILQQANVRAATAGLEYKRLSTMDSTDVSVDVSHGMNALGASEDLRASGGLSGDPLYTINFTRYNLKAKETIALPGRFGLVASTAGQYSSQSLPASEQISFGGYQFGLGYPQGEISGDKGLGMSLELNRSFDVGWRYLSSVQPYTSIDYARAWYNAPSLADADNLHLSSLALGLRFTDNKYYLFDVNVAKPIGSETADVTRDNYRVNANYSVFYDAF